MKKYSKLMAILLAVAMLLPGVAQVAEAAIAEDTVFITVIDQNLRTKNDDTASPVVFVPEGSEVTYAGETTKNGYFKLKFEDKEGYALRGDVTSPENYNSTDMTIHDIKLDKPSNGKDFKAVQDVSLRTGNSNQYRSLMVMPREAVVSHLGTTENGWFKVDFNGQEGYVYRGDVTSVDASGDTGIHDMPLTDEDSGKEYVSIIDQTLRTGNSKQYKSVVFVERGEDLKHLGTTANGWFLLENETGVKGYAYRGDVTSRENYDKLHEEEVIVDLEIESVSAINAKHLEVTFNKAVVDTTKAVMAVKKGISTVGVANTTWNEDKTVATLELNTKITEGTYDVTVTGLTEEALTGSVKAENEKVTEIKFLSDSLIVTDTNATGVTEVVTGYQLLNQYGEDVTSNNTFRGKVTFTPSNGTYGDASKEGKLTINTAAGTKVGDKVVITAIDSANAVTATQTFTIVDEAKVSEITLGEIYNKDKKELNEDTIDGNDFFILLEFKDQYGNAVTEEAKVKGAKSEIMILSSNQVVMGDPVVEEITINDKKQLALKLDPKKEGESLITVIAKANGKVESKKVTVDVGTKVDTVNIGTPEGTLTGNKKIQIPVEITNNKGALVTKVADVKGTTFNIMQGSTTITNHKLVEKDGQLFLELTTETVAKDKIENLLVTVQTPTNKFGSKSYQVRANAVAKALVGLDTKVSRSILKGETLKIAKKDFVVEDQYGNRITDTTKYVVEGADKGKYTVANNNATVEITVADHKDTNASETLEFTLVGSDPTSTIDVKFNMVELADFKTYKVEEIGLISNLAEKAEEVTNIEYAKELKVYGVTASGQEVRLPKTEYNVIDGKVLEYKLATNKVFVAADQVNVDPNNDDKLPLTKEGTLKVVINKTGQEIIVKGTASAEAPKATKVGLYVGGDSKKDAITNVQVANGTLNKASIVQELYIEDQFGVEVPTKRNDATLTFTNLKDLNQKDATIVNNGTIDARIDNFDDGDTVTVKITVDSVSTTVNATALDSGLLATAKINRKAAADALLNDLTETDYTAASWTILTDAIAADKSAIDEKTTVTEVTEYTLTAIQAKEDLVVETTSIDDAISAANSKAEGVVVSEDGTDVASGTYWVTQEAQDALDQAILDAEAAKLTVTNLADAQSAAAELDSAVELYVPADGTQI